MKKFYVLSVLSLLAARVCAQEIPSYCLENDIVYHYMNDFTYDDYLDDYDESKIMYYFDLGKDAGYRLDAPKPITLTWTNDAGATYQRIEVSESEDFTAPYIYSVSADVASYDVYNLIPGKTYYYRVISVDDSAETTLKSGVFNTTGQIRMILAEGTWNVRDMGGWTSTLTGKPVAYGKIFRGAQLKAKGEDRVILTEAGIEALRQVGIRAELDLRSRDNCPVDGSALAKDDGNGNVDVDFLLVPESVNARMYHFQNNDANIRELQWIINRLKQNKPVYFHCQNGADRTGTLGFLIGALLGVSEGDLAKDYEMTTFCQEAAVAYDPTEEGFARLRNYTGKKGSPLGGSEDNKEYMFAELANTMKSVSPVNGTYQQKIYNFFRTGVNGTKISAADLSWFIMEMTGYAMLGGFNTDVDTLRLEPGETHKINITIFPADASYSKISFKSTSPDIVTVNDEGLVTAVGGGEAYILVDVDGIEKYIPVIIPITSETIKEYSSYNSVINGYMSESAYSDDDYTVSYVDKYAGMSLDYDRTDWPKAFTLQWVPTAGADKQYLYVCDTTDFAKCIIGAELSGKDSTYLIDKLDPGRVYYYKVNAKLSSGDMITLFSSAFRLSSTVKMIKSNTLYNLRDLGGWTGLDGKIVKYGLIYRGSRVRLNLSESSTGQVLTEGARDLSQLGINAEIDLRSAEENSMSKSAISRSSKFLKITNAKDCLGANILTGDAFIAALGQIITWLKDGKKVYIGASLGAERTGALAFLINGLLGVNEDGLARDYELSSFTEDELAGDQVWKRNVGNYPAMVSAIKTLEGTTLQEQIYNYFKNGVNGKSITTTNLDWFIEYMLEEVKSPFTDVEPVTIDELNVIKRQSNGKIFNMFGFESDITEPGMYIIDGKVVYVTE